ncbi:MAG: GlcG/HbpS family heme-binding protein [Cetobacterium somerae]|uniref:GlcG/HbpS family heme-binding protein n=1 Tax=Cetobacterium somerae TaxID=188913 RepID=UPI00248E4FB4|nr:heme-binding protein [Cetobacterium somerae]
MVVKSFNQITLETSKKMGKAALKKALEIKVPVVFSVVDNGGNLLYLERMDEAFVTSVDIAINKAFTAWALKSGTNELSEVVLPGQSLYGLNLTNNSRIITFGGGFPIIINDEIVGAVGVSGGTVEEDMEIAKAALNSL